ncbi:lysozyme family protein [Croceifilum oryzae]|uniref:Lysozyme family protein n=1 Tax=Croceifilum oryzae TaxID=1553429 RepID=A0AAJ1TGX9_9BACL|nr:polymorphic toxin-type HINT domain-containing protein [Croceifilum oryzae]MDQ0416812.1 lysozyme family protein [Croceifilum oryzae]
MGINKSIEDIQVGDKVLSKDDKTGKMEYKKVTQLFKREVDKIYTVHVGKEKIETTAEHPFWVIGKGWMKAGDLQAGDLLEDENGLGIPVEKVTVKEERTTVSN